MPSDVSMPFGLPGAELVDRGASNGSCGSKAVHAEEEGALLLEVVDQVDAGPHHARGRVLALVVAVDRVPAHHRAQPADLDAVRQLGQQVALDLAARGGPLERLVEEAVGALREARLDPVDGAPEVGEARADQERVVGAVGGLDAGLAHHLGDDRVGVGDRDPARADRQALGRHVVAVGERAHAGEQRAPRRPGGHRLGHGEREGERVLDQRVEVGRLGGAVRVERADVVEARRVGDQHQRVRRVLGVARGGLEVVVAAGGEPESRRAPAAPAPNSPLRVSATAGEA